METTRLPLKVRVWLFVTSDETVAAPVAVAVVKRLWKPVTKPAPAFWKFPAVPVT